MSSHGANAYLRWYVRDFRSSRKVQRMGYIAKGLYRELLDEEFLEGSLPNDIEALAEICGCPLKVMEKVWEEIKPCFQETDGRLVNVKLETLRTDQDQIRVKRAEAGRRGGIAKQLAANAKQLLEEPTQRGTESNSQIYVELVANAKQLPEGAKQTESPLKQMPYSRAEQSNSRASDLADEKLDPSMVVSAVMDDLHLSGRDLRVVLEEVCNREIKAGTSPYELRAALVTSRQEYEAAKPQLRYDVGAARFFGECWRNKAGWPWNEGESPKVQAIASPKSSFEHKSTLIPMSETRRRAGIQ